MAWTLRGGRLALLAVLALLTFSDASGVYGALGGEQPARTSDEQSPQSGTPPVDSQPEDLDELLEKQISALVNSSHKHPLLSSESLNRQPSDSVVIDSADEVPLTAPPGSPGSNPTDGTSSSELRDDACCAVTPVGPPVCEDFTGPRQSPINIDPCSRHLMVRKKPLLFKNLHVAPASMRLTNTGNRLMGLTTWASTAPATISGGDLSGTFVLEIFDLHWGANSSYGSEHTINHHRYAAELHLGFRNIKYDTIEEAVQMVDGTASIAVFLDVKAGGGKRGIAPLSEAIFQIKRAFSSAEVASPPSLKQLLPHNLDQYVMYTGSPTAIEPCWGTVSWIVLLEPIKILDIELELLRDLRDRNGYRLCESSIRPLQRISARNLYTRRKFLRCLFRS